MGFFFSCSFSERWGEEIALQIKILQLLFHRRSRFSSAVVVVVPSTRGGVCLCGGGVIAASCFGQNVFITGDNQNMLLITCSN